jgi:hypothetical protein
MEECESLPPNYRAKGNSIKELAPVSNGLDAEVFQILRGEGRENRFVNVTFTKYRCIAVKTEAPQPDCEIHHVARESAAAARRGP